MDEGTEFSKPGDVERPAKQAPLGDVFLTIPSGFRSWPEPPRPPRDIYPAGMHPPHHPPLRTEAPEEGLDWPGVALEVHRWVCSSMTWGEMACGRHSLPLEVPGTACGSRFLVQSRTVPFMSALSLFSHLQNGDTQFLHGRLV